MGWVLAVSALFNIGLVLSWVSAWNRVADLEQEYNELSEDYTRLSKTAVALGRRAFPEHFKPLEWHDDEA